MWFAVLIMMFCLLVPACRSKKNSVALKPYSQVVYGFDDNESKKAPIDNDRRFSFVPFLPEQYNNHQVSTGAWYAYQRAKINDIPVPVAAQPHQHQWMGIDEKSQNSVRLEYTVLLSVHDVVNFYSREMERFGWQCLQKFEYNQVLMLFSKADKICSIGLYPYNDIHKGIQLVIMVGQQDRDNLE